MGNLITDKTRENLLDEGVSQEKLDDEIVQSINEKVEASFQEFLKGTNFSGTLSDEEKTELQDRFNGRLKREVNNILEKSKIEEIKKVNAKIESELRALYFSIELKEFQASLNTQNNASIEPDSPVDSQEEQEDTPETDTLTIDGNASFTFTTFKKNAEKYVEKKEVAAIFNENKNFKNRETLLNLLKKAKTKRDNSSDEIRQFQRIIVDIEDYTDNSQDADYKGGNSPLGKYGVDGKFGGKTLEAFKKYVEENPETEVSDQSDLSSNQNPTSGKVAGGESSSATGGDAEIGDMVDPIAPAGAYSETPGTSTSSAGSATGGYTETGTSNDYTETGTSNDNSESIELNHKYGIKSLYEGKGGETITIATGLSEYEIVPTVLKDQFNFEDKNGTITYTLPNENWEGTVSIKTPDEKIYNLTLKSSVEQKEGISDVNEFMEEINEVVKQKSIDEINNVIPTEIRKLKEEYKKIINDTEMNATESQQKINKIEEAMKNLLISREKHNFNIYITQALDKDPKKVKLGKRYLNTMIIDDAIIHLDGKDLSKKEFLQGEDTTKVNYIKKAKEKPIEIDVKLPDNFWDVDNQECIITKLIITDDPSILAANIAGNSEIQYDAYGYLEMEKTGDEFGGGDKKAIRKLIRGLDSSLSIVTEGYKKDTLERQNLRKLREGLMAVVNSKTEVKDIFTFIADKYIENSKRSKKDWKSQIESKFNVNSTQAQNIAKLGELYGAYKNNQDSKAMGDYFTKIMGLLENYFVRGVKTSKNDPDTVSDIEGMYKKERIGVSTVDLIDSDKEKKAINELFKKDNDLLSESYPSDSTQIKELNKLKNIVKRIDLPSFFTRPGVAKDSKTEPQLKNNAEKEFYAKYKIYVDDQTEKNDKGIPQISDDPYYNAVFDFLVGIGESRGDIVTSVNRLKLYNISMSDDEAKEYGFNTAAECQLVSMLCDTDANGRVDFGDRGYKMGLEIKNIYKDASLEKKYEVIKTDPMQNLVEYAAEYADKAGDHSIAQKLKNIVDKNKENGDFSYDTLFEDLKNNPGVLDYLQKLLIDSPANLVDNIFKYGSFMEVKSRQDAKEERETREAIQEIMNDATFNEAFEREYANLVKQGAKDTPEAKASFKPVVAAGLVMAAANGSPNATTKQEESWNPKLAVGGVLHTPKAGDFSLMLGVGATIPKGGDDVDLKSVGLCIGRGDSRKVGKKQNVNISTGGGVGVEIPIDNPGCFVPLASRGLEVGVLVNENKLKNTLETKPAGYIDMGGSIGIGLSGKDPVPFGEVHVGFSRNHLEGINRTYNSIKEKLGGQNGIIYKLLKDIDFSQPENELKNAIEQKLIEEFGKTEQTKLEEAADQIYKGLVYYMVGVDLQNATPAQKQTILKGIADNIAESYATSRKSKSLHDIEGTTKLSKFAVGVIFLADFWPIPMIGFNFTSYKGLYSKETQTSKKEYYRQLYTQGNAKKQEGEGFYDEENERMGETGIKYINEQLEIANSRVEVPDIEIVSAGLVGGGMAIKLPKDLYKYVNINVDPKLTNYAKNDDEGNVLVPANTRLTLLTSHNTDTGKFNLIIGDEKADSDDIVITNNPKLSGSPDAYKGDESEYVLDKDILNESMKAEFGAKEGFLLESCVDTKTQGGQNLAVFRLKEGIDMDAVGQTELVKIVEGNLTVPQTGTLTIYQTKDNRYHLYYQSDPRDNMNINYEIEGKETITVTSEDTTVSKNIEFNEETLLFGGIQSELRDILSQINPDDVHNLIFENNTSNWNTYTDFMDAACDQNSDRKIEESDYDRALSALRKMITNLEFAIGKKKNIMTYQKLTVLKNLVNRENLTLNQKIFIVDQCKMFFSYEKNLTDGKNDYDYLVKLVGKRGSVYENLPGYATTANEFPLKDKEYREKIMTELAGNNDLRQDNPVSNLVGMTAFYKKNLKDENQGRGYSMTEMGNTTPLGGKMIPIETSELEDTKKWFLKNLKASDLHKNLLFSEILRHISQLNKTANLGIDESCITIDAIEKIFTGEKNAIDIPSKNVKIDFNIDYVFYLLQECGNESIGIQLNGITIETGGVITTTTLNPANPDVSHVTVKNTKRKGGWGFYKKTHASSNEDAISRVKSGGFWLFGGAQKQDGITIPETETDEGGTVPESFVD